MIFRQKGFGLARMSLIVVGFIVIIGAAWAIIHKYQMPRCEEGMTVRLGQEFTIGKNCFVKIENTDLEVGIVNFYNYPCPKDVYCIASGLVVDFEYKVKGEVKKDINLVRDYGYQMQILKSDYETYARLMVEKSKSHYAQ